MNRKSIILALDTSTSQGGVALLSGAATESDSASTAASTVNGKVLSRATWLREKSHSEHLTPTIEECLKRAGLQLSQVDVIALGRGPGSFTGIRIAINAARSLAYALDKPVYAFDTLEGLAAGVPATTSPVVALVNAHKNLIYTSVFHFKNDRWCAQSAIEALSPEQLAVKIQSPHLCVGDAFEEYKEIFASLQDPPGGRPSSLLHNLVRDPGLSDFPLPEVIARLALRESNAAVQALDWKALQALYIRASGAEESLGVRQKQEL